MLMDQEDEEEVIQVEKDQENQAPSVDQAHRVGFLGIMDARGVVGTNFLLVV